MLHINYDINKCIGEYPTVMLAIIVTTDTFFHGFKTMSCSNIHVQHFRSTGKEVC